VKPVTPETTIKIENKLQDPANAVSINSIDGRLQIIGKSTSSNTKINIPNLDGSITGITLPSGYQGMFMLPFASGTGGFTSSGVSEFYFVKDGNVSGTDPTYGITRTSLSNGGKLYYVNSDGNLAKVANSSTPRVNWAKNTVNGYWEKKGYLHEPGTFNILKSTWTTGATFGVTGALITDATSSEYVSGYWDTTTIPDGLSVWKLTEITTGPNLENTAFLQASSIQTPLTIPYHFDGAGYSFSNFMVSAFFTGPNKISGITKDLIQIWLATNPAGTVKKSVYFNITDCKPVSVSTGGITLIHYNTELYNNGWCRCFAGIGYTGATYPTSGGIPQFGFSTARPDGAGGYTYGRLLGASAGSLFFSGVKIDYGATGEVKKITQWNSNRLAPTSYVPPNGTTKYGDDNIEFRCGSYPNWFYPVGFVTGGYQATIFYDFVINGAAGISGSIENVDVSSSGFVQIVNGRFLDHTDVVAGQNYNGLIFNLGLANGGVPAWRGNFYNGIYQTSGTFGLTASATAPTSTISSDGPSGVRGYTYGERFKLMITAATGDYRIYFNGLTSTTSTPKGPTYPSVGTNGNVWTIYPGNAKDKVLNILNWSHSPRIITETEGIASTSFSTQGVPSYKISGSDGGYNNSSGSYQNIAQIVSTLNNTSPMPPANPYPREAL